MCARLGLGRLLEEYDERAAAAAAAAGGESTPLAHAAATSKAAAAAAGGGGDLGLQSKVGERGAKLSGGERQRVGIARTLLRAPTVLVLDEATSALDAQTEKSVQALLSEGRERRTELLIAHRLSTIVHASEVLVLTAGTIAERGTHTELLQMKGGVYAGLYHNQHAGSGAGGV